MEEEFDKWFDENEKRFAHGQFDDKQIAYSSWLEGQKQALNIADVVGSEERAELPSEMPDVGTKEFNDLCSKMFGGKSS